MRRLFMYLILVMVATSIVFFTSNVSASTTSTFSTFIPACNSSRASTTTVCKDVHNETTKKGNLVVQIIKDVINGVSFVVGVAAIVIILISGLRLVIGGGDANT
jgi:hypothetical protein